MAPVFETTARAEWAGKMGTDLTAKQSRFVAEYLKDQNAKQAAIRSGYSGKTAESQGSRLLSNARVRAAVDTALADAAERAGVTAAYVLSSLKEVAERCMQRSPVMVRQGREMVQKVDEEGRDVWEFDSMGANTALRNLGQHLKLFTDKHEVAGKDGGPITVKLVSFADAK